jgi:hypothetical protein
VLHHVLTKYGPLSFGNAPVPVPVLDCSQMLWLAAHYIANEKIGRSSPLGKIKYSFVVSFSSQ